MGGGVVSTVFGSSETVAKNSYGTRAGALGGVFGALCFFLARIAVFLVEILELQTDLQSWRLRT